MIDPTNAYYSYGRIPPSPLLQKSHVTSSELFDWYFQASVIGNADHIAMNPDVYIQSLDAAINANEHLKNLPSETKLMVTIPVSGNEGASIYQTLKLYTNQGKYALSRTMFVLIVAQSENTDISAAEMQNTYQEIARAQKNFPELTITLLSIRWPKVFAGKRHNGLYSATLKILTDTCMRVAQRNYSDPIIITNDANIRAISKNYLLHYLYAAHNNPTADVFLGKIHWDIGRMHSVPGYGFAATVLMAAQDRLRQSRNDIPLDSWAANSGYRASALAAIGGVDGNISLYGSVQGFGADIDLGRRFFSARGSNEYFCMVHEAWVDSYGDRLLRQYLCNKSLTRAWDECDNNMSINNLKLFVEMTENIHTDFPHIKRRIEHILGLMFSDSKWACMEHEDSIETALNTVLTGSPNMQDAGQTPLWHITGKRDGRKITFTAEGEQYLNDVLPRLAEIIQDGLTMLDDMLYAELRRENLLEHAVKPTAAIDRRRIGSWALSFGV